MLLFHTLYLNVSYSFLAYDQFLQLGANDTFPESQNGQG